jgi:hypothetical protein
MGIMQRMFFIRTKILANKCGALEVTAMRAMRIIICALATADPRGTVQYKGRRHVTSGTYSRAKLIDPCLTSLDYQRRARPSSVHDLIDWPGFLDHT